MHRKLIVLALPVAVASLQVRGAKPQVLVPDGLAPAAIARLKDGGVEVTEEHLSAAELAGLEEMASVPYGAGARSVGHTYKAVYNNKQAKNYPLRARLLPDARSASPLMLATVLLRAASIASR